VPNPSFEEHIECPDGPNQVNKSVGWESYKYSPDYFNDCDTISVFSIPYNWGGYQEAANGNAYCAIATYATKSTWNNYREYIGGTLLTPLTIGTKYYISFKVNLSINNPYIQSNCASNKIGAMFSNTPYSASNPTPITNNAHINSNAIIIDTLNWTKIFGSFLPDSSYQYIILGNFFDDNNTDTLILTNDTFCNVAYYYIDDICLSTDSSYCANYSTYVENEKNQISIKLYPNPVTDWIYVNFSSLKDSYSIEIYNAIGEEIFSQHDVNEKDYSINISKTSRGFLIIKLLYQNQFFYYKLLKQ